VVAGGRWYARWYRESLAVDLAVAAYAMAVLGQGTDRLLDGVDRDWIAVPWAIGNLAEPEPVADRDPARHRGWRFPPARRVLRAWCSLDPRCSVPPVHERPRGRPGAAPGEPSIGRPAAERQHGTRQA
jgi:hypothetical protein